MRKKILMLVSLLAAATLAHAQRYMYVRDNDLFVNVRSTASAQANVAGTLYNLQVVKVEEPTSVNGWLLVDKSDSEPSIGFVHQSRLVLLPQTYYAILDSLWGNGNGETYIAAVDCPEIAVNISSNSKQLEKKGVRNDTDNACVAISPEDATIVNLRTGKELDSYWPITPINITLYGSRMVFSNPWYSYSHYRNRQGKLCRGLLFLASYDVPKLSATELASVLATAKKAVDAAKHIDPKSELEQQAVRDAVEKHIGLNNFDFLGKLERAYFNGNKEAKELYPYLLSYFPLDGDGTHEVESYGYRLWGFENRGEVELIEDGS